MVITVLDDALISSSSVRNCALTLQSGKPNTDRLQRIPSSLLCMLLIIYILRSPGDPCIGRGTPLPSMWAFIRSHFFESLNRFKTFNVHFGPWIKGD